jgi:hypothetical protein
LQCGWLAIVDWGTTLAPVYRAHNESVPIHVWVDETRPRNEGAGLTAWELGEHGVPHTIIVDNAGGHLMRQGLVDLRIVGTDRTTAGGDVANKIGTYLKALAVRDSDIPFYVALPSPTIDWEIESGSEIPIECRDEREVTHIEGWTEEGGRFRPPHANRQPRSKLCLRRNTGEARHRTDHRARHLFRVPRRFARAVPRTPARPLLTSLHRPEGEDNIRWADKQARAAWRTRSLRDVRCDSQCRMSHHSGRTCSLSLM